MTHALASVLPPRPDLVFDDMVDAGQGRGLGSGHGLRGGLPHDDHR